MAEKIDVESGNPYRDASGHFGTSPDQKLADSFKAIQGKTFVPKGKGNKGSSANKDAVKAKAAEAKEKLAALRNGPDTSGNNWKASGTLEEAEAFAKDSAVKDTLLHGTTSDGASSIKKEGFKTDKSITARMFGDGVYLTGDQETAQFYADNAAGGSTGSVMQMKINVKNPYIEDTNNFDYKIGEHSTGKFSFDMYEWGIKNKKWKDADSYEKNTDDESDYNKATREFANYLMETHDAIIQKNSKGIDLMIVKDPKNIMVIDNE